MRSQHDHNQEFNSLPIGQTFLTFCRWTSLSPNDQPSTTIGQVCKGKLKHQHETDASFAPQLCPQAQLDQRDQTSERLVKLQVELDMLSVSCRIRKVNNRIHDADHQTGGSARPDCRTIICMVVWHGEFSNHSASCPVSSCFSSIIVSPILENFCISKPSLHRPWLFVRMVTIEL